MCGIAGFVAFPGCDKGSLATMAAAIAHRGPDDEGTWIGQPAGLAYRRLAIIDLSPRGNQPMISHCGRYVMVYNGEIYNFVEIRKELEGAGERFRGDSDSEVLLAAFTFWGEQCVHRLNGMWSFAIWDTQSQRLFASRDRFGKKPFYYCTNGRGLIFASEVKALLATGLIAARPNLRSIADFASERVTDHRSRTFFDGVTQLQPGHNLTWSNGKVQIREFWRPDPAPFEHARRDAPSAEEVGSLLSDAVRIRLRADTPIGLLLSGGIDSSAISCLAATQVGGKIAAFSTINLSEPAEEAEGIARVANRFPAMQLFSDAPTTQQFIDDLDSCLWHQEEPFADGSMVAHFRLMRVARNTGVKVLLTGQGADELFGGYPPFIAIYLADLLRHGRFVELGQFVLKLARSGQHIPFMATLGYALPSQVRDYVRGGRALREIDWLVPEARHISPGVARGLAFRRNGAFQSALVDCVRTRTLPGFLHYEDRNSMAHGVETRLPFLDFRLAELLQGVPAQVALRGARTKSLLRDAMQGVVPPETLRRLKKQGYPAPIAHWLRTSGAETWDSWISAIDQCPLIVATRWKAHRAAFSAGDDSQLTKVWRGLVLALWYRGFMVRAR